MLGAVVGWEAAGASCSLSARRRTLSLSRRSFLANSRSSSSPSASASACHQKRTPPAAAARSTFSPTACIRVFSSATRAPVSFARRAVTSITSRSRSSSPSPLGSGVNRLITRSTEGAPTADGFPVAEKTTAATRAPQRRESSEAFFKSPDLRLEKVTRRLLGSSIRTSSLRLRPWLAFPAPRGDTIAVAAAVFLVPYVLLSLSLS